jgi:PAS domain S-box-containing protein
VWALTALAIVLLAGTMALIGAREYARALDEATELSRRRADRLAQELTHSLALAERAIAQVEARMAQAPAGTGPGTLAGSLGDAARERVELLALLPLPFELHALNAEGQALDLGPDPHRHGDDTHTHAQPHPPPDGSGAGRWQAGRTQGAPGSRIVPMLRAAAPNRHGVVAFTADLDHAALLRRFTASAVPGSGVALFRIEPDGSTTLLAREPFREAELGQQVRGPVAQALETAPSGALDAVTQLDGERRLVAWRRLDGAAADLAVAYGMPRKVALAGWRRQLPLAAGLVALLSTLMLWGGWRLDGAWKARARAADALARSEQQLREAQRIAQLGHWELDLPSGHLEWSDEVFRIFEVDPARCGASYEVFRATVHPDDREAVDRAYRESVQSRSDFAITHRLRLSDGRIKHVRAQGRSYYADDGTPLRSVGTVRDVTTRVQAEQALRDSEERLRLALEAAGQGLYDLDLRTGEAVVNDQYALMLGYDPATFRETNGAWRERLHPDDADAVQRVFEDYVAGRRPDYRVEFRQRLRDGGWKWILSVGRIQERAADGTPLRMLGTHTDLDAIKAAQAAQAAATRRFETLFQAAPEAISVSEFDSGRFLQVNDAFCELFGRPREAVVGHTSQELGMWTRAQGREAIIARLRAGEPVIGFEGAARRPAGETIYVMLSAERIEFDGCDALLLMFRDISERKRLEAALRASESRLAYLQARAPTVIYTARAEGDFGATYYSPNLPELLGWEPERFTGNPGFWLDHVHPDDRQRVLREMEALATHDDIALEYRFQHADGRWLWMRDQVSLQRDAAGAPQEIVGAWIDITARREAEEQLRRLAAELEQRVRERTAELARSEARYRAIFETVPVAIGEEDWSGVQRLLRGLRVQGVTDGPGYFAVRPDVVHECLRSVKVLRLNRKALALHDLQGTMAGQPDLRTFFPGAADEAQFISELEAMWAGERQFTAKRSLPSVTGRPLSLMMTISLPGLDDDDGTALVCLVDITEIDRLNAELDRSVARLKQVNRELETFTYSVSHDLKAPLRGIDGYSRLLLAEHRDRLDDEGRQFLSHIRQATQHMGVLIDDLLAYSRLERRELTLTALPLAGVVEGALAGLRADLAAAGVELEIRIDPALRVLGDGQGLTMALRNLVDNALKFSRERSPPRIVIAAGSSPDGVQLSVRDNGVGFDMKFHDRIFSIFQRLHRAEDYPGTGIGLAIVRKAMERMGGRVWADSQPGAGSTFTLELPKATS